MAPHRKPRPRSAELWMKVMREGRSTEEIARQSGLSVRRLERVLIAVSRRRLQHIGYF